MNGIPADLGIVWLGLLGVGSVFVVLLARRSVRQRALRSRSLSTMAVVVAEEPVVARRGRARAAAPRARVRYRDQHEREHLSTLTLPRGWERPRPGQWIPVHYDPEVPVQVFTTSTGSAGLHGGVGVLLGMWFVALLALPAVALLLARLSR